MPINMAMVGIDHEQATKAGAKSIKAFTVPADYPEQFDPVGWAAAEDWERKSAACRIGAMADRAHAAYVEEIDTLDEPGALR